jgi:hypothetical protein
MLLVLNQQLLYHRLRAAVYPANYLGTEILNLLTRFLDKLLGQTITILVLTCLLVQGLGSMLVAILERLKPSIRI